FKALREQFIKNLHIDPPPIPADPKILNLPAIELSRQCALLDTVPGVRDSAWSARTPITSEDVLTMEDVDQAYGFILYRKLFENGVKGELKLGKALDYSIVMIDGQPVGRAFAGYGPQTFNMKVDHAGPCTLEILVYNLGRNSVGINQSISRKGLNEDPTLDGKRLQGWQIFPLPLASPGELPAVKTKSGPGPAFHRGTFTLNETGETYLDMRNWGFGVVWVNGHNLGRYWDVGACRSLYLPSVWQKQGENEIVILELNDGAPKREQVTGATQLIVEPAVKFPLDAERDKKVTPE
ncbi:MAG TPA: hypothetical protein VLI90_17485, partial [Tepidisphaeraceae bacterium]|nr:hypothetical protein [Tepidisphaeraceae bacterium]